MSNVVRHTWLTVGLIAAGASSALAQGKYGFADVPGGAKDDPIIEIAASIGPNQGAVFTLTEEQANNLYRFDGTGTFNLSTPAPVIPQTANGANQFIRMKFPMKLTSKILKSVAKFKPSLLPTSYLTTKLSITDDTGAHVPGIVTVNGKRVDGVNVAGDPAFPLWLNSSGKNLLLGENFLTYIATTQGDQDLATIAAFGPTPGDEQTSAIKEVRIRLDEIGGVTVNGFWVLKIGTGAGVPVAPQNALLITAFEALNPVTPIKFKNGNQVVDVSSNYLVRYSEPVVPISVGFSADWVKDFNADNPLFPVFFNGNTAVVPNFDVTSLTAPIFPNFRLTASPTGVTTFTVPYNVRPINPNNLSEYVINPLLDIPAEVDITLTGLAVSANTNPIPAGTLATAATSLYNQQFNDTAAASRSFHIDSSRGFVNAPVAPGALYYIPVSGTGIGVINLDGNGFETNDPATSRVLVMTNQLAMCNCGFGATIPGPTAFGCNPNTFGDGSGANPIGLGGNPQGHLGGPTPVPGINEGSTGSTANIGVGGGTNPNAIYPAGFETVVRDSEGDPRLTGAPTIGSLGDLQVGDFLDKIYYDTANVSSYLPGLHGSFANAAAGLGSAIIQGNSSADPPVPNPPPLRLPVGLAPVDIIYNQQKLFKPAFAIEGDEVWSAFGGCGTTDPLGRVLIIPNGQFSFQGDPMPGYGMNGPAWQTFTLIASTYSSRQQIGNFLYASDRDQGLIQVLNSNNFTIVDTIKTPDPEGLGFSPDLKLMYVANYGDDSMSIVDTDPFSPSFHKEVNRVNVDGGPIAVQAQPEHDDVFVCNYFGNSVSIYDPGTSTIRKTVSSSINRPFDIAIDPRHFLTGFTNLVYFAYIGNQGSGTLTIYESGPADVGLDDIRWAVTSTDTSVAKFPTMRGIIHDMSTPPGSPAMPGGVYVSHRDGETGLPMVSRVSNVAQEPVTGPLPPLPPPNTTLGTPGLFKRTFEIVGTWGGPLQPLGLLNLNGKDLVPYDMAFADINTEDFFTPGGFSLPNGFIRTNVSHNFPQAGGGQWNSKSPIRLIGAPPAPFPVVNVDRLYLSFPGDNRIEVIDPHASGVRLNRIDGVPLPGKLVTYFDI
jgi:hypothetical protein